MSYRSVLIDRVYMVRWQVPQLADGKAVVENIISARKALDRPLLFIVIAPEDSAPPDDEMRKFMVSHIDQVLSCCEMVHFVMEGSGFKNSIKRSVLTNVLLLAGKRAKTKVHSSVDEALEALPQLQVSAREVRDTASRMGILPSLSAGYRGGVAARPAP